jgi:hypothetical protein
MKESDVRLQLHHALQWLGYWPYHHQDARYCPKCHSIITPEIKGRPDTEARHPRFPTALIEVKVCKLSFPFSDITLEQREYLNAWSVEGGRGYLCLGLIVPYGTRTTIRDIIVVPWVFWLEQEIYYKERSFQSVPWDRTLYKRAFSTDIKDLTESIPSQYFLKRIGNEWHFESEHPLVVQGEINNPFFKRVHIVKKITEKETE